MTENQKRMAVKWIAIMKKTTYDEVLFLILYITRIKEEDYIVWEVFHEVCSKKVFSLEMLSFIALEKG